MIVVEDASGAEADDLAAAGPDRPQQPAVEAVHRPAPALPRQARGLQFLELKTLAQQVLCQRVPARRGEPAAELRGGLGVEVALEQVLPSGRGLVGLQRLGVELLGGGVGGEQPASAAPVALHVRRRRAGVGDGVADPVGEQLDRLDEADVLDLLDERVDVAALAAAEAVEVAVVGPDVERRRLLVVERAQALQRVRARPAQLHVVADDVLDADAFTDGRDVAIGNPAGHRVSLGAGVGRDRLRRFEPLQPPLGERRDLVDDHPQPGAVVGGGVERGHEDRVERGRCPGEQPRRPRDGRGRAAAPGVPGAAGRT